MSLDSSIQVQAPDKSIDLGLSNISMKESTIRPKASQQDEINDDKENLSEESLSSDDPPAVPVNIDPLSVRNVEFQSERALMDKSDRKSAQNADADLSPDIEKAESDARDSTSHRNSHRQDHQVVQ